MQRVFRVRCGNTVGFAFRIASCNLPYINGMTLSTCSEDSVLEPETPCFCIPVTCPTVEPRAYSLPMSPCRTDTQSFTEKLGFPHFRLSSSSGHLWSKHPFPLNLHATRHHILPLSISSQSGKNLHTSKSP